jgi:hypothetical protein
MAQVQWETWAIHWLASDLAEKDKPSDRGIRGYSRSG